MNRLLRSLAILVVSAAAGCATPRVARTDPEAVRADLWRAIAHRFPRAPLPVELSALPPLADRTRLRDCARLTEDRLHRRRAARQLIDAGLALIAAGRLEEALPLLAEAVEAQPSSESWSALGTARLLLDASPDGARSRGAIQALDAFARGSSLDPADGWAARGLAEAATALGLRQPLLGASTGSVSVRGPASGTTTEMLLQGNSEDVAALVRKAPQDARLLAEEELLPRWSRAAVAGTDEHGALLARLRTIGRALEQHRGDAMLSDTIEVIEKADRSRRIALARAHIVYADGLERVARDDWGSARPRFEAAAVELARLQSPFASWALVNSGLAAHYLGRGAAARAAYARVMQNASGPRHPTLLARTLWLEGLALRNAGRPAAAEMATLRARGLYEQAGEVAHASFVSSLVGDYRHDRGDVAGSWTLRVMALRQLDRQRDPRRIFTILVSAAEAATEEGALHAARVLFQELRHRLGATPPPIVLAETELRHARLQVQLGDDRGALATLQGLRGVLSLLAPSWRPRVEADIAVSRAAILRRADPQAALLLLEEARRAYGEEGHHNEDASLVRSRAMIEQVLGRRAQARQSHEQLLRAALAAVGSGDDPRAWTRLFEASAALAELSLGEERPENALREILLPRHVRAGIEVASPESLARQPAAQTILIAACFELQLVTWLVADGVVTVHRTSVDRRVVEARVERFRADLRAGRVSDSTAGRGLAELLLAPFAAQLARTQALTIVPDRTLDVLPFEALPDPRDGQPLLSSMSIAISPAMPAPVAQAAPPPRRLTVLLSADAFSRPDGGPGWELQGARAEVETLRHSYAVSRVLYSGAASRKEGLATIADADVVHLAGHGLPGGDAWFAWQDGSDSVPLEVAELAALNLARHPTVVLAACGSAGAPADDFHSRGLAHAFLRAGARAIVVTLWDIADVPSAALLATFHDRLARGDAPRDALRAAQLQAARSGTGSATWAAFRVVESSKPGKTKSRPVYEPRRAR